MTKHLAGAALAGVALTALAAAPASAVDFTGKTIEWLIPFGVAGGSDV
jgi:hypothetical protein